MVMCRVPLIVDGQDLLLDLNNSKFSDNFQKFGNVELGADTCLSRFFLIEGD